MKVTDILARACGKSLAYDTAEEVTALLEGQHARIHDRRLPEHLRASARLSDLLAFQPGLVSLTGEAQDAALYLEALLTAARSAGHTELADTLQEAAAVFREATAALEEATRATVPQGRLEEAA